MLVVFDNSGITFTWSIGFRRNTRKKSWNSYPYLEKEDIQEARIMRLFWQMAIIARQEDRVIKLSRGVEEIRKWRLIHRF